MNKIAIAIAVLLAMTNLSCREDMQVQPKYKPLSRSWFYPDGRASRPIPPDTVAVDEVNVDPALETGSVNGELVTMIPVPVTQHLLARGREQFDIYCSPCHGRTGYGNGMIATRGFERPANLNGQRVRNAPVGYIYQAIVNGYGSMAGYSYQIKDLHDRWAIVAYLRALELSRGTSLKDVPAEEQSRLEAQR